MYIVSNSLCTLVHCLPKRLSDLKLTAKLFEDSKKLVVK